MEEMLQCGLQKPHREKRDDDQPAANECIFNTLPDILKTYKPFYVFNASRTGLYFRMLPDSLDIIKKICQGGGRHKKEILYQLVDPKTTISYLLAFSVIWDFTLIVTQIFSIGAVLVQYYIEEK